MRFDLQEVPKGKNLHLIGWNAGYLLVQFRGKPDRWIYGPDIPQERFEQLLRVPYPDSLFSKVIRGKFKSHKIGS
jgi:hypothetical protein